MTIGIPDCANCGAAMQGQYCAQCGQKAKPLNPSLRDFFEEWFHEFINLDGKIFKTVWLLLAKPGFLAVELFSGRRARYIGPLRLYLVFSLIFFALPGPESPFSAEDQAEMQAEGAVWTDADTQQLVEFFPRMLFVALPIGAFLVKLITRSSDRNYPQDLYFMLHMHSAYFAAGVVTELLYRLDITRLSRIVVVVHMAYGFWYVLSGFKNVYGGGWRRNVVRTIFLVITYFVIITLLITVMATAIALYQDPEGAGAPTGAYSDIEPNMSSV